MIFYCSFIKSITVSKEQKKELLSNEPVPDNDYDHLNMHHHPGNAKQEEELSSPERLLDAHKTNSIKPGETLHNKVNDVNNNHSNDVC